jgi:hypothetical protein
MKQPTIWWSLIAVAVLAALVVLNHYAPLQAEFVAFYAGLGVALLGLLCVLVPLRFLGIRRRVTGLLVVGAGVLVVVAALLWPAPTLRSSRPHQRIDEFMPAYSYYEFHETHVNAPPDAVVAAMHRVGLADLPAEARVLPARPASSVTAMRAGGFSPATGASSTRGAPSSAACGWTRSPWWRRRRQREREAGRARAGPGDRENSYSSRFCRNTWAAARPPATWRVHA